MKKIEHIGIAVKDLEAANATYNAVLGSEQYKKQGFFPL